MTTFKSIRVFIENGIAYLGIPEDMLLHFLDAAMKGKDAAKFEHQKEIVAKIGLVAAAQSEIDDVMANKIESTIIEQVVASAMAPADRPTWVTRKVKFDPTFNAYRYTNDDLHDLNTKLKLTYRLDWVYKIMSQRHATITKGLVNEGGKHQRRVACIDVPKPVIDAILAKLDTPGTKPAVATGGTAAVTPAPPHEASAAAPSPTPAPVTPPRIDLPAVEYEVANDVLWVLENMAESEVGIPMPYLRAKVDRVSGKQTDWSMFSKIVDYLAKANMITTNGNLVSKRQ